MNGAFQMVAGLLFLTASACQGDGFKLEPNATLRFDFPELPETLHAKAAGSHKPALLTAQLPENYSLTASFPFSSSSAVAMAVELSCLSPTNRRARDFICVACLCSSAPLTQTKRVVC